MTNEQKIKEVFADQAYVESLLALETPEEVKASLAEKDIDVSVDEVKQIGDLLVKKANGELSDEDLETVAGGFVVTTTTLILGVIALAAKTAFTGYAVHTVTEGRW